MFKSIRSSVAEPVARKWTERHTQVQLNSLSASLDRNGSRNAEEGAGGIVGGCRMRCLSTADTLEEDSIKLAEETKEEGAVRGNWLQLVEKPQQEQEEGWPAKNSRINPENGGNGE